MKAPKKVVFAFNPDEVQIPALTDRVGRILWACVRHQHIVSQHFNGNVQDVALRYNEIKPKTYQEFKNIIELSGLHIFGTYCPLSNSGIGQGLPVLDDEFWQGVWEYISGKRELEIEIKVKNESIRTK